MTKPNPQAPSRRSFLQTAGTAGLAMAATGSVSALHAAGTVHGGGGPLKIGLVGCGGRGTGAAVQAITAHVDNVLWAMGDAFSDRLEGALNSLEESELAARVQVTKERCFVGLHCIDQVLKAGVDVVLLASPPGFRPEQIEKAVAAGVHVFAEKPIATDAPGVRRVHAACQLAKQKNVSIVSGLCYRYHDARRALIERIHGGAIGDVLAIQGDYITGELWSFPRREGWSELEWALRNWLYYTWLSGDHIAEQHIHTLDVMAWLKQDQYPVKALGIGGRQVRTDRRFGNVYDHFTTIYEWADGARGYAHCRQQKDCTPLVNEHVIGSAGTANVFRHRIAGKQAWQWSGQARDMYQAEHDEMFAAIRAGNVINNGDYMCNSTLMAILGRMSAYTGKELTWEQAWNSQEVLMPAQLEWDSPLPPVEVAMPGITKFV